MNNIYVKSVVFGLVGVAGAYVLDLVLKWNESANVGYWAMLAVAFVVGSFIGLKIRAKNKK